MAASSDARTIDEVLKAAVAAGGESRALADAPNRASFATGDPRVLSWDEVDAAVDGLAGSLHGLGVGHGTPVGIQLPNIVELPLTILACVRLGAVAVPFPIQHRAHELRAGVRTARLDLVVTSPRPDRPDQVATVRRVLDEFDRSGARVATFDADHGGDVTLALDAPPAPSATATPNDVVTICWTSGTTGDPKGVPRTHSMWAASSSFQVEQLSLVARDRLLCPFPVVNMAGIGGMLLPWVRAGCSLDLHQPLDLEVFLDQMESRRITYTVAPPALLNMLLRRPDLLEGRDLSAVRIIGSGSAPLDPWMVEGWHDRGVEIVNIFGSNEGAALLATAASVPDPGDRARFFPRPDRPGIDARLVAVDTGEEIERPGVPGELRFRGATVFDGYVGSDGSEFDEDGYYRTGDVFEWVGDDQPPRFLRFVDRAKDIIIRGGMNVSAAEIEAMMASHALVAECAAVAYPDPELGERVGVYVVPAGEDHPTLAMLVEHLRAQEVASYKLPERLEVIDELPRNAVNKVVKGELRDRWRAG